MTATDDFITNLMQWRRSADSGPIIGDVDLFISCLQSLGNMSGTPGGNTTEVQYNNGGSFAGITSATSDGTTLFATSPQFTNTVLVGNTTAAAIAASGNISAGNLSTTGNLSYGNLSGGNITATGNISAGNLSATSGISSVTISATGNVSTGNLSTTGTATVTGNLSAGNITATSALIGATANISGNATIGNETVGNLTVTGTFTGSEPVTTPTLVGNLTAQSQVSSAAVVVEDFYFYNPNSSVAYIQMFDALTGNVTLGTTTPKLSIGVPAVSGAVAGRQGYSFSTGLTVAATTTRQGNTTVTTGVDGNLGLR